MKKSKKILCSGLIALTCGITTMTAQVTIGTDKVPASGALLDLKQQVASADNSTATKGFLYPRVALLDDDDLYPMFDVSSPEYNTPEIREKTKKSHIGLTVYNVSSNSIFTPGIYVWDGINWVKPVTKLPEVQVTRVNSVDLLTNYSVPSVPSTGAQGFGGAELPFRTILIPETGSYAFTFRLYGEIPNVTTGYLTAIYSLSIWADNVDYNNRATKLRDIAEIDLPILPYTAGDPDCKTSYVYTYSITLGGYFTKGETVKVKITGYDKNYKEWTLRGTPSTATDISAARTSVLWWKL